ncbi:MAG: indole-3-glycerol phosphate synthase TrpC [Pseudomonadota bacterium]
MAENVLNTILRHKAGEVAERAERLSLRELSARAEDLPPTRGFVQRLETLVAQGTPAVIAEIKKASPSKGLIRADFDPPALAKSYERGGAACLSVLTDERFFQGHDDYLKSARDAVTLPALRKDFTIDAYQVYEARVLGADCVLLIVAALGDAALLELYTLARELTLDVLIEVHDAEELERAQALGPRLIGVNNRNLKTFETSLQTTLQLAPNLSPEQLLVTESGIGERADVQRLRGAGVPAFLVGESLMRQPDPGVALATLFDLPVPTLID